MGLADFLADIGRGGFVGKVAVASGGRTTGQRSFDTFVNQELPTLMQEIEANTDGSEKTLRALGGKFVQAAARAGIPAQGIEKLMEMTVGPALKDLRLNAIRSELQPQPRPAGTEGPLTEKGNFRDPKEFDADMAIRAFQATGGEPQHFGQFIRAPAQIESSRAQAGQRTASQKLTEGKIAEQQKIDQAIEALPDEAPEGQISQRKMARLNRGGLSQYVPQRERPEDPLLDKRGALIDAQINAANARAQAAGREGRGSAMMQDFIRQGGDPTDMDAFIEYTQRRNPPTRDETDEADPRRDMQARIALEDAADKAGIAKLPPEQQGAAIKKLAQDLGYDIEGTPKMGTRGGNIFGYGAEPVVEGITGFRRKPKVTTKTKQPTGATPSGPAKSSGLPEGVTVRRIR